MGWPPWSACLACVRLGSVVLIELLLDDCFLVAAGANQILVRVVELFLMQRQLLLCEVELRLNVVLLCGARLRQLLLQIGDAVLIHIQNGISRLDARGQVPRLRSERRRIVRRVAQSRVERDVHRMVGVVQRLFRVVALGVRHGELRQLLRRVQFARVDDLQPRAPIASATCANCS